MTRRLVIAMLVVPLVAIGLQSATQASTASGCTDPTPYEWLPSKAASATATDPALVAELGQRKAALDANDTALQADLRQASSLSVGLDQKMQTIHALAANLTPSTMSIAACGAHAQRGSFLQQYGLGSAALAADGITQGTDNGQPFAWLNYLNQQAQQCNSTCQAHVVNYFCAPAAIAEETTTESVGVSQSTAASYMGSTWSSGTSNTQMLGGMQHYLGWPEYNQNWYLWQTVPGSPTSGDDSTFHSYLDIDIAYGMPVSGDAYEVGGYYHNGQPFPHLVGHPNITMRHWFEIGGYDWGINQVYYADSIHGAGTFGVFSPNNVPQFSWYDMPTLVVILGGLGYVW